MWIRAFARLRTVLERRASSSDVAGLTLDEARAKYRAIGREIYYGLLSERRRDALLQQKARLKLHIRRLELVSSGSPAGDGQS